MPASRGIAGVALVSGVLLGASLSAMQTAQAEDCSGILCIFGSRPVTAQPPAPPASPVALQASPPNAATPATTTADAAATDEPKALRKPRPKPVPW